MSNNGSNGYKRKARTHNNLREKKNINWILILVITTIILSVSMSSISSIIIQKINLFVAIFVLLNIILVGIVFDIVGIAVAAADETPFHAMASSKVKGAKNAIRLVRNANKVSTFCNDVVGDVCGVVSGSTGAFIVVKLSELFKGMDLAVLGIIISALVAALTVWGKGFGKTIAISKSNEIVFKVARLQYYTLNKLNIRNYLKKLEERRVDRSE